MDLTFSVQDEAFRARFRAWLEEAMAEYKEVMRAGGGNPLEQSRVWQAKLYEAGYLGMAWPRAYGGQEASLTEQVIVSEELARAKAPGTINTIGLTIAGPTIVQHGTEAQKQRFLPKILTAEELWCQGFSEPGAGSDLPALRTRAELKDDHFVVNGQKVWTSGAFFSNWCALLVRTDPSAPKRKGITYLLCDMKSPGIEVRPLRNAGGGSHFCEVFFDDVKIPRENMVGELHGGWQIARSTLEHERSGLSGVIALEGNLERLWQLASTIQRGDHKAIDEVMVRHQLVQMWFEKEGLRYLGFRNLSAQISGSGAGVSGSLGKLVNSQLRQKMASLGLEIAGPLASVAKKSPHVLDRGRWQAGYFDALGYSIGGGTSEIMHNAIAEGVLGLPHSADQ
ncbi:MAG: acyl-CoA dehydrogenase family protein [Kiritimatiellia bacterium]|jgi:alkylation response protein AidB-like acyl-CoA dehydrogenase|nr:acyl-CoA dehydrogenase family protein [Pseudomonadales bacterium]MDP6473242.1 acyl-CoA dehydrogenase family protein [Pseudomonadales bacterium]MDP6829167.1 acyl-CoA dehydrogenase family protein [Pseudomonadales bacterium]MDP7024714.1 acyl-CoA dehydrogenase family protein [Kiritimatiellia bacterium]|tara:strand:- start:86 stop:1270 length:1185 start_codon:yes stop_codon:yes gene_type:complete